MMLKSYQEEALDWLEAFFKRCKTSSNPRVAYEETTKDWRGGALHYRPLPTLPHVPYVCLRIPTGGGKANFGNLSRKRISCKATGVCWIIRRN
jgi:type III restriction enzyme